MRLALTNHWRLASAPQRNNMSLVAFPTAWFEISFETVTRCAVMLVERVTNGLSLKAQSTSHDSPISVCTEGVLAEIGGLGENGISDGRFRCSSLISALCRFEALSQAPLKPPRDSNAVSTRPREGPPTGRRERARVEHLKRQFQMLLSGWHLGPIEAPSEVHWEFPDGSERAQEGPRRAP